MVFFSLRQRLNLDFIKSSTFISRLKMSLNRGAKSLLDQVINDLGLQNKPKNYLPSSARRRNVAPASEPTPEDEQIQQSIQAFLPPRPEKDGAHQKDIEPFSLYKGNQASAIGRLLQSDSRFEIEVSFGKFLTGDTRGPRFIPTLSGVAFSSIIAQFANDEFIDWTFLKETKEAVLIANMYRFEHGEGLK